MRHADGASHMTEAPATGWFQDDPATLRWFILGALLLFVLGTFPSTLAGYWSILALMLVLFPGLVLLVLFRPGSRMLRYVSVVFAVLFPFSIILAVLLGFLGLFANNLGTMMSLIFGSLGIAIAVAGIGAVRTVQSGFAKTSMLLTMPAAFLGLFGAWSVLVAAMAVANAERIAEDTPYCIADTSGEANYTEVRGLGSLRGAYFYTTATGFKHTSQFWLHGVLATPEIGSGFWNWSLSKMSFDPLRTPDRMVTPIGHPCKPRSHFAFQIGLW
jgi:hypothetical protein